MRIGSRGTGAAALLLAASISAPALAAGEGYIVVYKSGVLVDGFTVTVPTP